MLYVTVCEPAVRVTYGSACRYATNMDVDGNGANRSLMYQLSEDCKFYSVVGKRDDDCSRSRRSQIACTERNSGHR